MNPRTVVNLMDMQLDEDAIESGPSSAARQIAGSEAVVTLLVAISTLLSPLITTAADTASSLSRPVSTSVEAEALFKGEIKLSAKDSRPDWPVPIGAPKSAPNIVLIMLDDVGFGDTSTFGGPVHTPALDQLAAEGLRYNRFHTAALCSPTRAALLSGRNQHRVGYGEFGGVGYPGYNGRWEKSTASIAKVLMQNGYSTAAFGKWHNTPFDEITPVGPFHRWPTGLGFEYYYGNMMGVSSQWEPLLWRNTERVLPPNGPDEGYHYTTDITNEAIRWLHTHNALAPNKPYFMYLATGAAHGPLHVPKEWIDKYRGHFNQGWDKLRQETFARQKKEGIIPSDTDLTTRPKELPPWNSFSADAKRFLAHQMEVYAAFLAHTDYEIGRLIDTIRAQPNGDNTLILYIVGDNGAEPAGGIMGSYRQSERHIAARYSGYTLEPHSLEESLTHMEDLGSVAYSDNYYPAGWAWAGNTPFQWAKHAASHFGGTRNPLVVSWPAHIKERGGLRSQFTHVNDVAATLYEVVGVQFPESVDGVRQLPLDGVSFADSFERGDAPNHHRVQYFETHGNRAIYQDGWLAAALHSVPWILESRTNSGFENDRWELYRIDQDFSQAHDLANRYPEKLKALQSLFDEEAHKNNVYPLGAGSGRAPRGAIEDRKEFTFHQGFPGIWSGVSDIDFEKSHRITADLIISKGEAQGVIIAAGTRDGGFTLYVKDQRILYEKKSRFGGWHASIVSNDLLPVGKVEIVYEFIQRTPHTDGVNSGRLYMNGHLVGAGKFSTVPSFERTSTLDIGMNSPSPVSEAYKAPFEFTGTLKQVKIEIPINDRTLSQNHVDK